MNNGSSSLKISGPSIPPTRSWRLRFSSPFRYPILTSSTRWTHYKLLVIMSQPPDKIIKIHPFSAPSPPCSFPRLCPTLTSAIKFSSISSTFTPLSKKRKINYSTLPSRPTFPLSTHPAQPQSSSLLTPLIIHNEMVMFIIYIISSIISI